MQMEVAREGGNAGNKSRQGGQRRMQGTRQEKQGQAGRQENDAIMLCVSLGIRTMNKIHAGGDKGFRKVFREQDSYWGKTAIVPNI